MQNSNSLVLTVNGQTLDIGKDISKFSNHMMAEFGEIQKDVEAVHIRNVNKFVNIGIDAIHIADYHKAKISPLKVLLHEVTIKDGDLEITETFDLVKVKDFWKCLKVLGMSPFSHAQMTKYMKIANNSEYILGLSDENKALLTKVSDVAVVAGMDGGIEEWKKEKAEKANKPNPPKRSEIIYGDIEKNLMKSVKVMYYLTPESDVGYKTSEAVEKYLLNKLFAQYGTSGLTATNIKELTVTAKKTK